MQFGSLTLKRCRYGWMLFPVGRIYVGKCFDLYGQYSEGEVALMRALLREGDTVIDVGANVGALTVPMSQIVGDTGRVFAIESDPETFNVLCANLALNGIRNVTPLNTFITDRDVDDVSASGSAAERWPTGVLSLDSLKLDACHFIKVDVDGSEIDVFRGCEMQIERFRPILYFENELREKSVELLTFLMDNLGYHLYFHPAPLFDAINFFGNSINHWAPTELVSMMMLGVPQERKVTVDLKRITNASDWWDFTAPVSSYFTQNS